MAILTALLLLGPLGASEPAPLPAQQPQSLRWQALQSWRRYSLDWERESVQGVEVATARIGTVDIQFVRIRRPRLTTVLALPCPGMEALSNWTLSYTEARQCTGPGVEIADRFMSFQRDMMERVGGQFIYNVPLFSNNGDWYVPAASCDILDQAAAGFDGSGGVVPMLAGTAQLGARSRRVGGSRVVAIFRADKTHITFQRSH